jgi:putative transposase
MVLEVELTAANVSDVYGGGQVLVRAQARYPRLARVWADLGYKGLFPAWAWHRLGIAVELTSKPGFGAKVTSLRPKRWIVERTFAWLGRFRRLSKDYEYLVETSRAMIYLALTRLMLRRLVQGTP